MRQTKYNTDLLYSEPIKFTLYKDRNRWVFDDEDTGLVAEAFVMGMDKIIDQLNINNDPRPTFVMELGECCSNKDAVLMEHAEHVHHSLLGDSHWYRIISDGVHGVNRNGVESAWLCPNIHLYYKTAPKVIAMYLEPN